MSRLRPRAPSQSTLLRMAALAALASGLALISNDLASPARRLSWKRTVATTPSIPPLARSGASEASHPQPTLEAIKPVASAPVRPLAPRTPVPDPSKTAEAPVSTPIREISGTEVWKAFQSGVPFLDARRSAEFAEGHIAGAWCAPVWEADLDDRLIAFKAARRPGSEDPIVIYCSGGDCRDSHLLAAKLLDQGYFHLLIYRDGFPDWVAQKRPIEKGQP